MKKLRIVFAAMIAVGLFIGFSAFSKKTLTPTQAWFQCIDPAHPDLASSYIYLSGQSPSCSGSNDVCAVYADVANEGDDTSEWYPVESTTMTSEKSLEQIGENSSDFTSQTNDVRLEE